uniref:STAS domain-containing protein n=1 Tax=Monopterus albus TaxID=43700 RepID=A0A3Q3JDU6_MONAL
MWLQYFILSNMNGMIFWDGCYRCPSLKRTVTSWVPILGWLPQYSLRENAIGDLIAGFSVASMHLPQGMAYAPLAAIPTVHGLYTSFYPILIFAIFSTSRHVSIGTFSVISMMAGSATVRLAPDQNFLVNGTNGTTVNTTARDVARVQIACSLALLTGIFQILLGIVRFGFVVTYLSQPLIRAYTTASACQVASTQLKYLFGVSIARYSGPLSLIYTVVDVCRMLPKTRVVELVVGVIALSVLIVIKNINYRCKEKMIAPIPIELILVIVATIITHYAGLIDKYGVDVVGVIPSGFRAPVVPDGSFFPSIAGDAISLAIVSYTINIALAKTFALKHGYKVDNNQELAAVGLSNGIGSFFFCYNVSSSLSRSLVQETTGGKTQVAGVVSSIIVLVTILGIGALFEDLPKVVLASIVFVNLKGMFIQFADVHTLWKTSKVDLLVWLITFVSALLLNLDIGLAVSVGFSVLTIVFRLQLPHYSILGLVPGTDLYLDIESYKEAKEIPGIKIFRSSVTIYHTNAEMYLEALQEKTGIDIRNLLTAKKKQDRVLKCKQEKEKEKAKKEAKKQKRAARHRSSGTCFLKKSENNEGGFSVGLSGQNQVNCADFRLTEASTSDLGMGHINQAYQHDTSMLSSDSDTSCHGDDSIDKVSHDGDEEKGKAYGSCTHSIILDISTTNFVDIVAVNTLKNIFRDAGELDMDIYLAGCQASVVKQLETARFFSELIPKSRLFVTVHDAVLYILKKQKLTDFILDVSVDTYL